MPAPEPGVQADVDVNTPSSGISGSMVPSPKPAKLKGFNETGSMEIMGIVRDLGSARRKDDSIHEFSKRLIYLC